MSEPSQSNGRRFVRVLIAGRVQGVGFRAWTAREAVKAGLAGWVCNRADGRVEAVFGGPPHEVDAMLGRCRKGPVFARVDHLTVEELSDTSLLHDGEAFNIRTEA